MQNPGFSDPGSSFLYLLSSYGLSFSFFKLCIVHVPLDLDFIIFVYALCLNLFVFMFPVQYFPHCVCFFLPLGCTCCQSHDYHINVTCIVYYFSILSVSSLELPRLKSFPVVFPVFFTFSLVLCDLLPPCTDHSYLLFPGTFQF